jgi:hypothetical protein
MRETRIIRNIILKLYGRRPVVRPVLISENNIALGTRWEQLVEALRYEPEWRGFDCR